MKYSPIAFATFILFLSFPAFADGPTASPSPKVAPITDTNAPLALIYSGKGACSVEEGDAGKNGYGCSEAAADIASLAGFQVQFVGPTALTATSTAADVANLFGHAKVWIQPGGEAKDISDAMSDRMKTELVNFISNGGGYVGICAGAFFATDRIGGAWFSHGLGIFPGRTSNYKFKPIQYDYAVLDITWQGTHHDLFFEGGPYFSDFDSSVEVVANFQDGKVAAARTTFNKGRVFLSGPHIEAPSDWTTEDGKVDSDGSDYPLGVGMIQWAAGVI